DLGPRGPGDPGPPRQQRRHDRAQRAGGGDPERRPLPAQGPPAAVRQGRARVHPVDRAGVVLARPVPQPPQGRAHDARGPAGLPPRRHRLTDLSATIVVVALDLTSYRALSFDCYGTLIDWEAGIAAVLGPWAREQGLEATGEELLLAYADNEAAVERET